jgi:hypothetical protein
MSNNKFLERTKIELNETQTKMLISGWGKDVYENSIVTLLIQKTIKERNSLA